MADAQQTQLVNQGLIALQLLPAFHMLRTMLLNCQDRIRKLFVESP